MIRLTFFVLILLFFSTIGLFAQKLTKGFELLENEKFVKAQAYFEKQIEAEKEVVAAKFGLAQVLNSTENPEHNYAKAFKLYEYCEKKLTKVADLEVLESAYGINTDNLAKLKESAKMNAMQEALNSGNEKTLSKFMKNFPDSALHVEVNRKLDSILYFKIPRQDTPIDLLRNYLVSRPNSVYADSVERKIFEIEYHFLKDSEDIAILEAFLERHKKQPECKNLQIKVEYLYAKKAPNLSSAIADFMIRYPESEYSEELSKLLRKSDLTNALNANKTIDYESFIKKYPDTEEAHTAQKKIIKLEYNAAIKTNKTIDYESFIKKYPDTEEARTAQKKIIEVEYNAALKTNKTINYESFIKKYPDSDEARSASEKIVELEYQIAFKANTKEAYKKFQQKYPDSYQAKNFYTKDNQAYRDSMKSLGLNSFGFSSKAKARYEVFIKSFAPRDATFAALQFLIKEDVEKRDWKNANTIVQKFKNDFGADKQYLELVKILTASPLPIRSELLSPQLDIGGSELAPAMTADEQTLYFCSHKYSDEDIFVSEKLDGIWQAPNPVSELNSTTTNDAPLAVSADGNRMLMFVSGDIYYADKTEAGWSEKTKFPKINISTWNADACLTADGNAVIFASGTYNSDYSSNWKSDQYHIDIFVSEKNEQGEWSNPINIGKSINTIYDERSPFLHSDMKTLYFSSNGHGGLGGYDVYKVTRTDENSWTSWSAPINLGKEVNTYEDEYFYKISNNGSYAYFSGFVKGVSGSMLYKIPLPDDMKPQIVTTVSGKITDDQGNPLFAEIRWEDLNSGKQIGTLMSNPKTGEYFITLPNGKNYGFYSQKEGYFPASGSINLKESLKSENYTQDIELVSVAKLKEGNVSISLKNIFFETNKYELKPESYPELKRLAQFMSENSDVTVEISGHTDNVGTDDKNEILSQNRAEAVREYLISIDCNPGKLTAKGYGSKKPVAKNDTPAGKALNRRVEFKILK